MIDILPNNWIKVKIKDVGNVKTGNTPSKKEESNYGEFIPFVKPPQLQNCEVVDAEEYLSESGLESGRLLKSNSVLVSCIGNLGRVAFNKIEVAFNQQINAIEFEEKYINPKFYFYYFQTMTKWLYSVASATTLPIVNKSKFENAPVLLPPHNEQHRIVEKIEELFSKLDAAQKELKNVKQQIKRYRQSVLKSAFEGKLTEFNIITEKKLEDMTTRIGDGLHGTPKYNEEGEYYFINGNNLNDGIIEFKDSTKKCLFDEYEKYKKELNSNTVLVSINGTIGNTAFYNSEKVILGKSACYMNLKNDFDKKYLRYYLKTQKFINYANLTATGSTIKNVPLKAIRNLLVPLPSSLAEQQKIVEEIETRFSVADKIEEEIDRNIKKTEQLRQSILKQAFQGKLVPQDPNDPPASELLKRIKNEKVNSK